MAFDTFAHPLTVHDGRLVLGMLQPASVRAFDGVDWDDLGNPIGDPQRCDEIHSLATYRGALHAGTWPLGRVARWDPRRRRWLQAGRLGDSTEVMALNVYNGKLYGAAIPRAEIFRYECDRSWTSLRRLFDPPGWRPVLVEEHGAATRRRSPHARVDAGDQPDRSTTACCSHRSGAARARRSMRRRTSADRFTPSAPASSRRHRGRSSRAATTSPPSVAAARSPSTSTGVRLRRRAESRPDRSRPLPRSAR